MHSREQPSSHVHYGNHKFALESCVWRILLCLSWPGSIVVVFFPLAYGNHLSGMGGASSANNKGLTAYYQRWQPHIVFSPPCILQYKHPRLAFGKGWEDLSLCLLLTLDSREKLRQEIIILSLFIHTILVKFRTFTSFSHGSTSYTAEMMPLKWVKNPTSAKCAQNICHCNWRKQCTCATLFDGHLLKFVYK